MDGEVTGCRAPIHGHVLIENHDQDVVRSVDARDSGRSHVASDTDRDGRTRYTARRVIDNDDVVLAGMNVAIRRIHGVGGARRTVDLHAVAEPLILRARPGDTDAERERCRLQNISTDRLRHDRHWVNRCSDGAETHAPNEVSAASPNLVNFDGDDIVTSEEIGDRKRERPFEGCITDSASRALGAVANRTIRHAYTGYFHAVEINNGRVVKKQAEAKETVAWRAVIIEM